MKKKFLVLVGVLAIGLSFQFASFKTSLYTMQGIVNGGTITLENGQIYVLDSTYKDGQAIATLRNVGNDSILENDIIQKIVVDN